MEVVDEIEAHMAILHVAQAHASVVHLTLWCLGPLVTWRDGLETCLVFLWCIETGSCYISQAGIVLAVMLPLNSQSLCPLLPRAGIVGMGQHTSLESFSKGTK